ncbi:MAG: hypothetical protein PHC55_01195 [Bacteroidales bacterium]|nr:hypothetical protein [Bacteroidales bacterium]
MKKLIVLILAVLPFLSFAQSDSGFDSKGKIEIYAGYGLLTAPDIITGFSDIFTSALLPGMIEKVESRGFGAAFGGLDYYISNHFTAGLQYSYASYEHTYDMQNQSVAKMNTKYHTLLARGKGIWLNTSLIQLYSVVAVGPSFTKADNDLGDTKTNTAFAFHVSLIGIRVGNQIAFFTEGGFGYQGLISAGVSVRF